MGWCPLCGGKTPTPLFTQTEFAISMKIKLNFKRRQAQAVIAPPKTIAGGFWQELLQEPPLAWAQLAHRKVRLSVALAGIAFANILIFTQLGFSALLFDGMTRIHERLIGDLFMVSRRAKYLGDESFSKRQLYQAAAVEGIASASPLYYSQVWRWVNPQTKETKDIGVIAFNPAQPVLDLPEVHRQLETIKLPDVVLFDRLSQATIGPIPQMLAQGKQVKTELSRRQIQVGGLYTLGSSLFKSGHIITSDQNYLRIFGSNSLDKLHVAVLRLEAGSDLQTVKQRLIASLPPEVKVLDRQEFMQMEKYYWEQDPAGVVFNFGTIMGFIVGVVVVYQVLYSDVSDHLPEYATLKAMGYSDRALLQIVFQEALILAVLGFLPGCVASIGMYQLLAHLTRIPLAMRLDVAVNVLVLTMLMCLMSAAIASQKLRSADPADIF